MSELDTRFLDRRPPPELIFGTTFSNGSGKDISNNALGNGTANNFSTVARVVGGAEPYFEVDAGVGWSPSIYYDYANASTKFFGLAFSKISLSYWIMNYSYTTLPFVIGTIGDYTKLIVLPHHYVRQPMFFRYPDSGYQAPANSLPVNSTWAHVVMTWDTSLALTTRCKIYINGVSQTVSIRNNENISTCTTRNLCVGSGRPVYSFNYYGLIGRMSKLLIFENKILTQAEVSEIYNHGRK
jgi:hypothetical protein